MASRALFGDQLSLRARLYIGAVILLGAAVLAHSIYFALVETRFEWIYLASLTVIASFFAVLIPSRVKRVGSITITVSDIFIFTSLLLFGPEVAVLICAIDALFGNFRAKIKRLYKRLFNVAQLALVTFLVGKLFYALHSVEGPPVNPQQIDAPLFFVQLGLSALIYFTLNSGAVALAMAISTNQSLGEVWTQNLLWASLPNLAGASAAGVICLYFNETYLYGIGLALPILGVIYFAYKMNLDRVNQAHRHVDQINEMYHSTIASLAMAIDAKDQCTHGHVHRVQALALGLARYSGEMEENEIEGLRAASLLHDIGKLAIPEHILNKPTALTESEMQRMKLHPTVGADILESVPFPYPVVPYVRHHHEKWDGTGYPAGLRGLEIPIGARILAIADCYDALRSDRPYRGKLSKEVALDHILSEAGKAYDPDLVELLVEHIDELDYEFETTELRLPEDPTVPTGFDPYRLPDLQRHIRKTVFHEIASTQKEIQTLYEISQALGKSLNVTETMTLLATKIRNLVPYSSCAVFLVNSQNDRIIPYHTSGTYTELLDGLSIKLGEGVSGWVAANHQPLMNVSPSPDFMDLSLLRAEFKSCLAVPLSLGDRLVGVITLYSSEMDAYRHDHLRVMETISQSAAAAINNAIVYEETQEDAYTDLLTGLPNLRYFNIFAEQELRRAGRLNYPVTILMMDLELFKDVNDHYGHRVGDRFLVEISHILRNQMRKSDSFIRYGGDEFVGILPGVSKPTGQQTIDRIQQAVDTHQLHLDDRTSLRVGISIGAATFPEDGKELESLIARADQAMYRNKVVRTTRRERAGGQVLPFGKRTETS